MSRAFVKEDAGDPDELPDRPIPSSPNYVTPYGLDALRRKAVELKTALAAAGPDEKRRRALARELKYHEARIAGAILIRSSDRPPDDVRFGATVTLAGADGTEATYSIVGQDEAEEGGTKVSWDSSLALTLIGAKVGSRVEVPSGGSTHSWTISTIAYL